LHGVRSTGSKTFKDKDLKKIMIAIPAYTGQIHLGTMRSLMTDILALKERGDAFEVHDECGNALIADARAQIVSQFLASDKDILVFIDSDVSWEAGALLRIIDHPVDMVAGIYPQRKDPINYCVKWIDKPELYAVNGLLEVEGVPAGFMKLSRTQLERMVSEYQESEFYCENAPNQRAWALFADYRNGIYKMGEDYSFCKRWTDIGGKVWIDPEIKMGHCGLKTFVGHIGDYLRNR
jgi:hypothetical protein